MKWEGPLYDIMVLDKFGDQHYIRCHQYDYDAGMMKFYQFGGGTEEVVKDGNVVKRAIMNLIGIYVDVAGFESYEVEDENEGSPEV